MEDLKIGYAICYLNSRSISNEFIKPDLSEENFLQGETRGTASTAN